MADPVSWLAIELIETRLKAVSIATGYLLDLNAGVVTTDPAKKADAGAIHTLISAGGFTERPESSGRRMKVSDMDVAIEVTVPFDDDKNAAKLAHYARADVIRAVSGGVLRTEEGVRAIDITGSDFSLGVTADGAAVVIAQVTARAGLAEPTPPAP